MTGSTIIPALRYEDSAAAIEWLCRAFGFEEHAVFRDEDGRILHAQLTLGGGMVMMGSARDDDFGRLQKTPADVGGVGTQSPYVIVSDADAHYERAKAAGAAIVYDIRDEDYGGRGYSCRPDPVEGDAAGRVGAVGIGVGAVVEVGLGRPHRVRRLGVVVELRDRARDGDGSLLEILGDDGGAADCGLQGEQHE